MNSTPNFNFDKSKLILGIESSCDDTSIAILRGNEVLVSRTANQSIHEQYGGVVPELASRAHQSNIVPLLSKVLTDAKVQKQDIQAIAYTRGPGLLGSLMVGSAFAKGLSISLGLPLIPVNHMEAHIFAHFINEADVRSGVLPPVFPFLCLIVSGGHTQIVQVNDFHSLQILGTTLDDAAGEAFDKGGKTLGLPYPAGPIIDSLAKEGDENSIPFVIAQVGELNYSFSGLKTFLLRKVEQNGQEWVDMHLKNICAGYQKAIVDSLLIKLKKASAQTGIRTIAISGGVAANSGLRKSLLEWEAKEGIRLHIPKLAYCTDNGAMIAMAGLIAWKAGKTGALSDSPMARMEYGAD
jgi:N6-L-threonylcarbamoyladenine synthase